MSVFIEKLAKTTAIIGGVVLFVLVLLICISVLGRAINTIAFLEPVQHYLPILTTFVESVGINAVFGDFEIVEMGIAFCIFCFLPYCQFHSGHTSVDVFTTFLPKRINQIIIVFWDVVLSFIMILIAWRLFDGMISKMQANETTLLLEIPMWWGYGISFLASLVSVLVSIFMIYHRLRDNKNITV